MLYNENYFTKLVQFYGRKLKHLFLLDLSSFLYDWLEENKTFWTRLYKKNWQGRYKTGQGRHRPKLTPSTEQGHHMQVRAPGKTGQIHRTPVQGRYTLGQGRRTLWKVRRTLRRQQTHPSFPGKGWWGWRLEQRNIRWYSCDHFRISFLLSLVSNLFLSGFPGAARKARKEWSSKMRLKDVFHILEVGMIARAGDDEDPEIRLHGGTKDQSPPRVAL